MDLILVPFHDYKKWINEGFRTRDAHLYQSFLQLDNIGKILIINRPTSLIEMILKRKKWRTNGYRVLKAEKFFQIAQINEKTYVLDILVLDTLKVLIQRKKWWQTSFSYKKVIDIINYTIEYLSLNNRILFVQNPMSVKLYENLNVDIFGFDAIDNWLTHPQMKSIKNIVAKNYEYVDKNASFISTVSQNLQTLFSLNPNNYWIPNGVDRKMFCEKKTYNSPVKICYIGKIQDRVDFDLVEKCLIKYPENNFDFIGPILSQKKIINNLKKKYRNISFLGDVHYSKIPNLLTNYDVGIIPHVVDQFTNSMNPLKVYEYLASGLLVVSTACAGVSNISEYVFVSNNEEEFISNLQEAMQISEYTSPVKVSESFVEDVTWMNRGEQVVRLLEEAIIDRKEEK